MDQFTALLIGTIVFLIIGVLGCIFITSYVGQQSKPNVAYDNKV